MSTIWAGAVPIICSDRFFPGVSHGMSRSAKEICPDMGRGEAAALHDPMLELSALPALGEAGRAAGRQQGSVRQQGQGQAGNQAAGVVGSKGGKAAGMVRQHE
eukprot:gene1515-biopygen18336